MISSFAAQSSLDPVAVIVTLPKAVPTVLAVGAFLKNTLCLTHGTKALISRDVGNLESIDAVRGFEACAEGLLQVASGLPVAVAHDLHPDFHSTRWAEAFAAGMGIPAVAVQHHHAHVAAVMAEHGTDQPALGLALDGFGLGADRQSWGGELLCVDADGYRRLGHLAPLAQPGGDKAAREPWRMGAAALFALGRAENIARYFDRHSGADVIARMLRQNINCPPTTSCGRLFDAACGLLKVKPVASFEGEAPMELERLATHPQADAGLWRLEAGVLDLRPLLERLIGLTAVDGANLFHGTLADAMAAWVDWAAEHEGIRRVALSGGCFLNQVLSRRLIDALRRRNIVPLQPIRLPPGDSAISLGQAWAAAISATKG
ncbi:MAG: carbamoyltransferase HypF [Rhodospirillales bacterium]|nr:carbamoyltransferase HypF [Rhodospirillales bacterium]